MSRYIQFVIRFRYLVLLFFTGLTALFGFFFSQAFISSTPGELFFSNNPMYERYLERNAEFGGDHIALIAFEDENLLSPESSSASCV